MLSKLDKWMLFLSSYLPLYVLIIVKDFSFFKIVTKNLCLILIKKRNILVDISLYKWYFFCGICILMLFSFFTILRFIFSRSNKRFEIEGEFEKSGDSIISYIFTYLVPLLSMDIDDGNSILINFLLFVFIGVLYVAQDLIYLNPILALIGYSFYTNEGSIVITKFSIEKLKELKENKVIVVGNRLGSDIFIYRRILKTNNKH